MSPVYLLVLVLGCSLLAGQSVRVNGITLNDYKNRGGRENEIQAENPTIKATTTTQESCQPDIHSVLREMSAVLAELKVEQRHTTTAVNNLESRLRTSESQAEELKKKSEEALTDLKNSLKITENKVEILKKENQEKKVVFSASLSEGSSKHHGPYSTDVTLVYKHVFINIGKAYNPVTGFFTAPVRGIYEFKFYAYGHNGKYVSVAFQKNGQHIVGAHARQDQYIANTSNGVSLLLEDGDSVCVKVRTNHWIYDDWFHHSTFSGQMLFPV